MAMSSKFLMDVEGVEIFHIVTILSKSCSFEKGVHRDATHGRRWPDKGPCTEAQVQVLKVQVQVQVPMSYEQVLL